MKLSQILMALLSMGVLLGGFLLWRSSPETFSNNQNNLVQEGKVVSSSSLEFENLTEEEGDESPSFPAGLLSIEQAIQNVLKKYPGRVTRAELLFDERGAIYEVDVQRGGGEMTVIEVDAETGQVLGPVFEMDQETYPGQTLDQETEI